jgi:hypothetical protein
MGNESMSGTLRRRLPAYGRQVRDNLNAGRMPALGGCVAVCIGWPARCVLTCVVCAPDEGPATSWDFAFLSGIEAIVWFSRQDNLYAEGVRRELVKAGCPLVAMLRLPEDVQ